MQPDTDHLGTFDFEEFVRPDSPDRPITPPEAREFEIFNDRYYLHGPPACGGKESGREDVFPLFCQLPLELRLKIWTASLKRHRFVRVVVSRRPDSSGHGELAEAEGQRAGRSGQDRSSDEDVSRAAHRAQLGEFNKTHQVWLRAEPPLPALFHTCRESAHAARNFYRLPLQVSSPRPGTGAATPLGQKTKVVLLNPEWDILDFPYHGCEPGEPNEGRCVVEALHSLKAADPRGRGALNLSLDSQQVSQLADLDRAKLSAPVWQSYRDTIANLHRLYWRVTSAGGARLTPGFIYHTHTLPWYNVSMPMMAEATVVEFLGPDPRPISPDLHQVWFRRDPRRIPEVWSRIESNLGVRTGQDAGGPLQRRILLASDPWDGPVPTHGRNNYTTSYPISDRRTADIHLTKETQNAYAVLESVWAIGGWRRGVERYAPELSSLGLQEMIDTRVSNTAVGFWLIDPAELRPASTEDNMRFQGKMVIDMMGQDSKLELCLFDLRGSGPS